MTSCINDFNWFHSTELIIIFGEAFCNNAIVNFKIGFVVRRCHFQNARAEFKIHMLVADNRNEF